MGPALRCLSAPILSARLAPAGALLAMRAWRWWRAVIEVRQGNAGNGLAQDLLNPAEAPLFVRGDKSHRLARGLHSGRPSHAVHVIGGHERYVVVDHVGDALDIDL